MMTVLRVTVLFICTSMLCKSLAGLRVGKSQGQQRPSLGFARNIQARWARAWRALLRQRCRQPANGAVVRRPLALCRGPRPAAHAAERQPAVAGSFFPSFEDPQDSLHIPANLTPRRVRACTRLCKGRSMHWRTASRGLHASWRTPRLGPFGACPLAAGAAGAQQSTAATQKTRPGSLARS